MKKITLLLILAVAFVATSAAEPLCTTFTTLQGVIDGGNACEAGNLLFSNFSWITNGGAGNVTGFAASSVPISVTAASDTSVTLRFGTASANTFQTQLSTGVKSFNYKLIYDVSTIVRAGALANAFTGNVSSLVSPGTISNAKGFARLTKEGFDSELSSAFTTNPLVVNTSSSSGNQSGSTALINAGNVLLMIYDDIFVQNRVGGAAVNSQAAMNFFEQTFNNVVTPDEGPAIPEPLSFVLMGSGLLGLGLLRKRVAKA